MATESSITLSLLLLVQAVSVCGHTLKGTCHTLHFVLYIWWRDSAAYSSLPSSLWNITSRHQPSFCSVNKQQQHQAISCCMCNKRINLCCSASMWAVMGQRDINRGYLTFSISWHRLLQKRQGIHFVTRFISPQPSWYSSSLILCCLLSCVLCVSLCFLCVCVSPFFASCCCLSQSIWAQQRNSVITCWKPM